MSNANDPAHPIVSGHADDKLGMTKREMFVKDIGRGLATRTVNMSLPLSQQDKEDIRDTAIELADLILEALP